MFQLLLSLLHGRSCPESGSSINNYLLGVHVHSLDYVITDALILVQDSIMQYPSLLEITIGEETLRSVKNAIPRSELDLDQKRNQKQKEGAVRKVTGEREDDRRHAELKNIKLSVLEIKNSINVAEEILAEGNKELKELLSKSNATKSGLQRAQSKMQMDFFLKSELSENNEVLLK